MVYCFCITSSLPCLFSIFWVRSVFEGVRVVMSALQEKWLPYIGKYGENPYQPFFGWSNLAQPVENLDKASYRELAVQGTPNLAAKMAAFCEINRFSYIFIPHEDYRLGFEKGTQRFRTWLNDYCHENRLNPNVQVAIVGPCVKDEDSTEFKSKARPDDRVRDYLRGMYVFLQGRTLKSERASLDNIGNAIDTLQNDGKFHTIARKNYLHTPKNNGYRAYKAAWNVPLPGAFSEWEMLAEIKIEHESQQDVNRMTRRFMSIGRQARDAIEKYYPTCTSSMSNDFRNAHNNISRIQHMIVDIDRFSKSAYDLVHEWAGLNRFLDASDVHSHAPVSLSELQGQARKAIDAFGPSVVREIQNAGLRIPGLSGLAAKLEKAI